MICEWYDVTDVVVVVCSCKFIFFEAYRLNENFKDSQI